MKKIFENAVWWSGVITVGLVLGISLQFVKAWTEPGVAPPGGNVGAPINTSAIYQIKAGILGVMGLVTNSFQMTTGAGAGKVLTSDATGMGSWALEGGSYSYTYYCFTPGGARAGKPLCADSGNPIQGYCPAGWAQKESLGKWGACLSWHDPTASYWPQYFLPPGGTCASGESQWQFGDAYICASISSTSEMKLH